MESNQLSRFEQAFLANVPGKDAHTHIWIPIIHAVGLRVFAFCLMYMISSADPSKLQ